MIVVEILNEKLKRTYSNENFKIMKISTGEIYYDAIDIIDSKYEYSETSEKIEGE